MIWVSALWPVLISFRFDLNPPPQVEDKERFKRSAERSFLFVEAQQVQHPVVFTGGRIRQSALPGIISDLIWNRDLIAACR